LENDHLNTVGKFHVVKLVPLSFIHEDEGKRRGSIYGFLPSTDRVLEGIFLILLMYTYALILGAEQGLQVYHDGEQRTSCYKSSSVSMSPGTTTNLASGTFELHSIGWVVSPFATVRSEILFYSSLDSYDKNKKFNDNSEYMCSYMEELAHYIHLLSLEELTKHLVRKIIPS
nr:hypothetical protein [Tanacetum cinerariifolium]